MSNPNDGLNIYSAALTALITIISAALAAAVAILQFSKHANEIFFYWAIAILLLALISVFLAFSGLTGQATVTQPDITVTNITLPARAAVVCLVIALFLIGFGIKSDNGPSTQLNMLKEVQVCRTNGAEVERLRCFESWFDNQIQKVSLENIGLSDLNDDDKNWIKKFILNKK